LSKKKHLTAWKSASGAFFCFSAKMLAKSCKICHDRQVNSDGKLVAIHGLGAVIVTRMYRYGEWMMRVIAGTARRLQLKTIDGLDTRPTTDRIKETLFNMLAPDLYNSRFLDLFAGSGGIGIEALSRGAKEAVFVEKNPRAMACIKENLKYTRLDQKAVTMQMDALEAVHRLHAGLDGFDFIFMDPPYHQEWERQVLEALADGKLLSENGIVIIEAAKDTGISFAEELGFRVRKEKVYKTNKHIFLDR